MHHPKVAAYDDGAASPRLNAILVEYSGNRDSATHRGRMTSEMARDEVVGVENAEAWSVEPTHMRADFDIENSAEGYTDSKTYMTAFMSSSLKWASPRKSFKA